MGGAYYIMVIPLMMTVDRDRMTVSPGFWF